MIREQTPLTLAEVGEMIGDSEKARKVKHFIKEFSKIKPADSKKLKEELEGMNMIKLKQESIVNIVNFLPQDASDIIKILPGISLEQEEITKILEIVKKYL